MVSNGFKLRDNNVGCNGNGNKFIYMAFAEFPLVSSNSKPGTARQGTTMLGLNAFAEHAFASIGQGYYVLVTGYKITVANIGAGVQVSAGATAVVTGEKIQVSQNAAGISINVGGEILGTTN